MTGLEHALLGLRHALDAPRRHLVWRRLVRHRMAGVRDALAREEARGRRRLAGRPGGGPATRPRRAATPPRRPRPRRCWRSPTSRWSAATVSRLRRRPRAPPPAPQRPGLRLGVAGDRRVGVAPQLVTRSASSDDVVVGRLRAAGRRAAGPRPSPAAGPAVGRGARRNRSMPTSMSSPRRSTSPSVYISTVGAGARTTPRSGALALRSTPSSTSCDPSRPPRPSAAIITGGGWPAFDQVSVFLAVASPARSTRATTTVALVDIRSVTSARSRSPSSSAGPPAVGDGDAAQHAAQLAHHRRGHRVVPDDVPDDEHRGAVLLGERVVPVTADLRRPRRRDVAHGDLDVVGGDRRGEHAALELLGHLPLPAERLRVRQRDAGPPAQVGGGRDSRR